MKKLLYIAVIGMLLGGTACRKYVEIPPEMTRELKYTADYQALMYNTTLFDGSYSYPLLACDDIGSDESSWQDNIANNPFGKSYTWSSKFLLSDQEDQDWARLYTQIRNCNIIINGVMSSEKGTDAQKHTAQAYAQVHRAYAYLMLVNMYAKQYDAATAATDPGVPLLLNEDLFVNLTRTPVQAVYNQILTDLNSAVPYLPPVPTDAPSNPSQAAAYALLARTYLLQRNFTEAEHAADQALQLRNTVSNLNNYTADRYTIPNRQSDPECIFFKGVTSQPTMPLSAGLQALLGTKDLRYVLYTAPGDSLVQGGVPPFHGRAFYRYRIKSEGNFVGPSVPEMMLIKAECEARADHAPAAIDLLNTLRKKRFTPADYADLSATTGAAALTAVVNERRLELMGRGLRWFDQRRLQKDAGLIGTVTRNFQGTVYTLAPGDNRYVFPIADKYILLNPEITQNPR